VVLEKLRLENSLQASKILALETSITSNSTSNMVVVSQPILDIEIVKFIAICVTIIGLVIGSYYYFNIFFQKSIIGKVVVGLNYWVCSAFNKTFCGGSSFVKTVIIPFNEQSIELKIEITANDTCSVTYRYLSDNIFLPFEKFLEEHQALLDLFDGPDPDLAKITRNCIESSSRSAIDVVVTSPEVVLYGKDALKAVLQL